jgi:phosphoribosyl 1,2-cyclic phosphate phosphodiesterase
VPRIEQHVVSPLADFTAAGIRITPIQVNHGNLPILGYRVGALAYLTDYKTLPTSEYAKLQGLEVLVVSALQQLPHHSHATLEEAVALVEELDVPKAYFTHLSHSMGTHADTAALLPPHIKIAHDGLSFFVGAG